MTGFVIVGAGGRARTVQEVARALESSRTVPPLIGHLVDEEYGQRGDLVGDATVLGGLGWLQDHPNVGLIVAVGDTQVAARIVARVAGSAERYVTLIHPTADLGSRVTLGPGTVVQSGAVLGPGVVLGNHCNVSIGATVSHDVTGDSFVSIGPGATISGHVQLGKGTFIGSGAVILPHLEVGQSAMIGGGAVVTRNVPASAVWARGIQLAPLVNFRGRRRIEADKAEDKNSECPPRKRVLSFLHIYSMTVAIGEMKSSQVRLTPLQAS